MAGTGRRPLLFLDVDGTLIPYGGGSHPLYALEGEVLKNPLVARIDPEHGQRLAALPCDIVWATAWMSDANEQIAPRLGLPELPVVIWPEPPEDDEPATDGVHWKTRTIVEWAAGRSFAWVDDELTGVDREWVAAHHDGPALLHRVHPERGLTEDDYALLYRWLRAPE